VSRSQHREFADIPEVLGWIPNGVEVERFPFSPDAGEYLIWVGRICEEKAPHIAIDVAARAGLPLVIVGPEQLYSCHQRYADQHLKGRMNSSRVHFAGNPDFTRKAELLQQARALLVTSQAEETSSLVAMEAMACGTPVIALNRGALAEVVAHSETGFVVDTEDEMVEKIACIGEISREACRAHTVRKHSASKMGARYAELYARVVEAPVADARDYARPVLNAAAFD
jgi:glycosyltransferase involved in cell wall biosynthesis